MRRHETSKGFAAVWKSNSWKLLVQKGGDDTARFGFNQGHAVLLRPRSEPMSYPGPLSVRPLGGQACAGICVPYFPGESINLGMASAEEPVRQGDVELDLMKYWNTAFPPQTRYDLVCCLGSLQFPVTATRPAMTLQSAGVPGDLAKLGVAMPRARSNKQ